MSSTRTEASDSLREYGGHASKVEPGGIDRIPESERHGSPWHLFSVWTSPNLEFATVFVGVLGVAVFGLSFWQTVLAIVLGNLLGAAAHVVLSSWGPEHGLAQMVLSRTAFGRRGNVLPAGLNAVMAGLGWFAVNSVSGAYALATLFHVDAKVTLALVIAVQVVVAFFGHALIHLFERVALVILSLIFVAAAISTFAHADLGAPATGTGSTVGGFLLVLGATFGYATGWNPYASDYTRYLRPGQGRQAGIAAGLGLFVSCALLETVGAASATIATHGLAADASPTDAFTHTMPSAVAAVTLAGIAIGAISANVLNIYSGSMAFLALGIKLPLAWARGAVAIGFGIVGGAIAYWALPHPESYENFLLVIAYWIGPWLGIVFLDRWLDRRRPRSEITAEAVEPPRAGWAAPVAMLVAMAVGILLFSNQSLYVGVLPAHDPAWGDLGFEAGTLVAAVLYAVLRPIERRRAPAASATSGISPTSTTSTSGATAR